VASPCLLSKANLMNPDLRINARSLFVAGVSIGRMQNNSRTIVCQMPASVVIPPKLNTRRTSEIANGH